MRDYIGIVCIDFRRSICFSYRDNLTIKFDLLPLGLCCAAALVSFGPCGNLNVRQFDSCLFVERFDAQKRTFPDPGQVLWRIPSGEYEELA